MAESSGIGQFRLTKDEAVVLSSMQASMIDADISATRDQKVDLDGLFRKVTRKGDRKEGSFDQKSAVRSQWGQDAVKIITKDVSAPDKNWDPASFSGKGWRERYCAQLAGTKDWAQTRRLAESGPILAHNVVDRSRAYLLLIELYSFHPWPPMVRWNSSARKESLESLTVKMPPLTSSAYKEVDKAFKKALRRLQRKTTNWWKVAGFLAVGAAIGALTLGLAAPLIGAAIGSAMGLSGAAATSAGLALLGGGSLAAGGAGMAGGTTLIVGAGALGGSAMALTTSYAGGWTAGRIAVEAIKLEVLTQIVLLKEQGDDATARLVVQSLEERLREVEEKLQELARKITALRDKNSAQAKQLREQEEQLQFARDALQSSIEGARESISAGV